MAQRYFQVLDSMDKTTHSGTTKVLFACLGNICRSPTAHGVFGTLVKRRGLGESVEVDSCGTGGWHIGEAPDARATAEAARKGYDLTRLRARQVQISDFEYYDYILAMDLANLSDLQRICPDHFSGHLGLFLEFSGDKNQREVPDPYYGGGEGFSQVLDLVETASEGLLNVVQARRSDGVETSI
jgi:protein-tyrosine phosphatase